MLIQAIVTAVLFGLTHAVRLMMEGSCWLSYFKATYRLRQDVTTSRPVKRRGAIMGCLDDCQWYENTPGDFLALRVHRRDVGGAITIVEARVLPLSGPPIHIHEGRDEIFEVLEGRFRFQCAGDAFEVSPGMKVVVPRGVAHAWVNLGPTPARLLFSYVPGGMDKFFEGVYPTTSPNELAQLAALHDTWIVGPPLVIEGAVQPCQIDDHDNESVLI